MSNDPRQGTLAPMKGPAQTGTEVYRPQVQAQAAPQQALVPMGETAGNVLAAQAKALVEARYTIALRQPRDFDTVRQKLLKECARPYFADTARYRKPVGNEGIEGPSIRFVEAALQAMGNIMIDTVTTYDDPEKRIVRVAVADMETNVVHSREITVRKAVERRNPKAGSTILRQRTNSKGITVYLIEATDDEMLNTENALVSKALRTQGLRLIPKHLTDECMDAVIATQKKRDAEDPDAARNRLLDAFAGIGISVDDVQQYLGHDRTPTPKEVVELRAVFQAVRDGEATWRDVLDAVQPSAQAKPAAEPAGALSPGVDPVAMQPAPGKGVAAVKAKLAQAQQAPAQATQAPATVPAQAQATSAAPAAAQAATQQTLAQARQVAARQASPTDPDRREAAKNGAIDRLRKLRESATTGQVKEVDVTAGPKPLKPMPAVPAHTEPRAAVEVSAHVVDPEESPFTGDDDDRTGDVLPEDG